MMTNLFSTFDPTSSLLHLPLNWLSTSIGLFMLPIMFWLMPTRSSMLWNMLLSYLNKEFKMLLTNNKNLGSTFMFLSLLTFIMFNNFMGLFPYIFTSSSHLTFTLTFAMIMWLTFMLYGWTSNTQHMFAHLVPQGTPPILMPFMVCIETISNVIRPITLSVRLAANMIAGHLLLTLLGNTGPMMLNSMFLMQILITTQIMLLLLETAVSLIQSYVFAVLTTLYSSEVN
uniref:ATP synthase subunit a n=1 Tax=Xenogryllus marmoratus TaxID=323499 RepID=A0A411LWL4_9ORTH|nr:ATP synthase F0 subunit 6 [Xenogryllus marmoratus]QBF03781.1 ATP synthase F0 subunit 6 [Xenogryllus marmoratus]